MELRRRSQRPSEASSEDSRPYASCPSPSPGCNGNLVHRSASTGGIGNDRASPHAPPRPFPRSTAPPIGPCNPTRGVTLDDSISPLPLSYVPARSDRDQGVTAGATSEDPPSSVPPPPRRAISEGGIRGSYVHRADVISTPPWTSSGGASHNNGRKILLLALHLIALLALSCAALYLHGAMTTVEVEHKRRMRDEAVAKENGELMAEIGALQLQIKQHESSHPELLLEQQRQGQTLESLNTQHLELHKVVAHTTNLVTDASGERKKYRAMVDGVEELGEYMKSRETELWKRIEGLESRIGRESYREALEWFGPGPHKVEFEVEYPRSSQPPSDPDPATWKKWKSYLLMEMAPLDLMPHTVNLFLKQVHHQLWDGTYVTVNAPHVMQIGPRYEGVPANVGSDEQRSYQHFHAEGLDKVSYQEYSPKYPHEQYTIGMSGRPSGPDLYINKMNNTVIHGPGGQMNDGDMHNEADPCFGRLVTARVPFLGLLEAIDLVPLNSDYPEAKVRIKSAKILLQREGDGLVALEPGKKWDEKDKIVPLPEIPHGV